VPSLRIDLRAFALVLAPILVGWLFLAATDRSGSDEGIYAESPRLTLYKLPRAANGHGLSFANISAATVIPPDPGVRAFFIVGPHGAASTGFAGTAETYLVTTDAADARVQPQLTKIPSQVHRVNARTYRIDLETPAGWIEKSPAYEQYFQSLATTHAGRGTLEVSVALVLSDASSGTQRMYPVRIGPL